MLHLTEAGPLHIEESMSRHKLFYKDSKTVRDSLNQAIDLAHEIHHKEQLLVERLYWIDQERFYIRFGDRSLTGFCRRACRFSKTQAQRIVTRVRRYLPTDNIVDGQRSHEHRGFAEIQRKFNEINMIRNVKGP